jgi:nickel-dependent lactate racemase
MHGIGFEDKTLSSEQVFSVLQESLDKAALDGKKVLVLTPDTTRTVPMPMLINHLVKLLSPRAGKLDFMVALGTHPPLSHEAILELYGLDEDTVNNKNLGLLNHRWDLPGTLTSIGRITDQEVAEISGGRFNKGVEVEINRAVLEYDQVIILGPVFPHEVAGFSGGEKYLYPGISGGEMLHFFHWLSAVVTCPRTIGIMDTPVRRLLRKAGAMLPTPVLCISMVVHDKKSLSGIFVGPTQESWTEAAKLADKLHVVYKDKPYHTVLGVAPAMYDEIWVAGKVMYKLEPVVAPGGKLIIYGKHIDKISQTWGEQIASIGYHVRDYFLEDMERTRGLPLGVVAHSTHVRGVGEMVDGVERPRVELIFATSIPEEVCKSINVGYMDPESIELSDYQNREEEGVLFVDHAGEVLHRLKDESGMGL